MFNRLTDIYAYLFSKPYLHKANNFIMRATLRARGYNNHANAQQSGEQFFIEKILKPLNPSVCIDIGANVGEYSEMLLQNTNGAIYSFEPLPDIFRTLKARTERYGARSIVNNCGVGSTNTSLDIHYDESRTQNASFSREMNEITYVNNDKTLRVDVVTLDSFFDKNPVEAIDFIKIDTEGFEMDVLKGAQKTIAKYHPKYIQVEYNWHHLFKSETLHSFTVLLKNYDVYQLLPNGWIKRDPKDPYTNLFHYSNFVFVRQD